MTSRRRTPRPPAPVVFALACALACACSAVDDFTAFQFADGGARDLVAAADLAGSKIGDACDVAACTGGLACFTTVGNTSFPGGVCSTACSASAASCPMGAGCGQVDGTSLCLAACNPTAGVGCRIGWSCCDGQNAVSGSGLCAPSNSSFCGH